MSSEVQRKLTTILAADAEGYSRIMQADEVRALGALRAARSIFSKIIQRHHGRIANTAGDGLIAEFPSVVEAVQCAIEVQQELTSKANDPGGALHFRIGIHLGDVMIDGDDILGEGVNLAARLQSMAEPGGILISQQVYDQVHAKLSVGFDYLGEKRPKNFSQDVSVYGVSLGAAKNRSKKDIARHSPARPSPASRPIVANTDRFRDNVIRVAKLSGAILITLVIIDLGTGAPFWAHFPGLLLVALFGLYAAPLMVVRGFDVWTVRGAIIAGSLLFVNLFTWSGYVWALWPAGLFAFAELVRHIGVWRR